MTVKAATVYVITCNSCGRHLTNRDGAPRTYADPNSADLAAKLHGWTTHPRNIHYCPEGSHA